jgi:hypothetical protein
VSDTHRAPNQDRNRGVKVATNTSLTSQSSLLNLSLISPALCDLPLAEDATRSPEVLAE